MHQSHNVEKILTFNKLSTTTTTTYSVFFFFCATFNTFPAILAHADKAALYAARMMSLVSALQKHFKCQSALFFVVVKKTRCNCSACCAAEENQARCSITGPKHWSKRCLFSFFFLFFFLRPRGPKGNTCRILRPKSAFQLVRTHKRDARVILKADLLRNYAHIDAVFNNLLPLLKLTSRRGFLLSNRAMEVEMHKMTINTKRWGCKDTRGGG